MRTIDVILFWGRLAGLSYLLVGGLAVFGACTVSQAVGETSFAHVFYNILTTATR